MQPYFMPYAGYFRLLAATDLFVVYDCVQFPRRGWVHRNKLPDAQGRPQWLTLPLAPADVDTAICDLQFRDGARDDFERQMRRFPSLATVPTELRERLLDFSGTPVDYLERTLAHACASMGMPFNTVRSSTLGLPGALRGQDRILAIAKAFKATRYLNASGGTALYNAADFSSQGIELQFLPEWQGDFSSVLERLLREPPGRIADDIRRQCTRP
ncbi:WbqC family protein [Piscinibacter terrae]|uniref:WbqC-like protein family protein n=1 Tax=Piscinibacter terrae TaxID=2496871 RepID=A0A3N7HT00_9BURK|nr:WbqC family protein [Albitalea terrae]RQP24386.1 hypothetical protein DZC73_13910 [Albitalea terrae]